MDYTVLYHGFDGLEFAIKTNIPAEFSAELEVAKEEAGKNRMPSIVSRGSVHLEVKETGVKGGYAFSCSEPETGNWFFKKPNPKDPWGIRFSAASSALAIHGLEGLRTRIKALLRAFGIHAPDAAYNISRADLAVDFLAPMFILSQDQFVMHSRSSRKSHGQLEDFETNGHSSRNTSVTVGQMPNRQVIIYDKREEARQRKKVEWAAIWARSLYGPHANPLDLSNRKNNQIWRIEIRVAKRHLKDVWGIKGWESFYTLLPEVYGNLLHDIRYCAPTTDENRSRWPTHPMWIAVKEIVDTKLFEFIPNLTPEEYAAIKRDQKLDELRTQIVGLAISTAAIEGIKASEIRDYLARTGQQTKSAVPNSNDMLCAKLARAKGKYGYLAE